MHAHNGFTKFAMTGALVAVCTLLYSTPASAVNKFRSFYQNTGSNCRGATVVDDIKMQRFSQSLRNTSSSPATVVCNFTSDRISVRLPSEGGGIIDGNVAYVAVWAKDAATSGPTKTMSCTMRDGYVDEPGSLNYPNGPLTLARGTAQTPFQWTPTSGKRFLAPINVTCTLPPNTELNDWYVVYEVDVGL